MKIRFSSSKEQQPTQDQGLQVLYAPGKRLAFKLRWYLILLAVLSPLLWLLGSWLLGALLVEAPAQLVLANTELRAREPAQVQQILVRPGERVAAGQVLVRLDNPEWRARLALLAEPEAPVATPDSAALSGRERDTLLRLLASAEQRLAQLSALQAAGAATRGEVQVARDERDRRQRDLLQFERQQAVVVAPDAAQQQRLIERAWLQARLEGLALAAPAAGVVSELLVAEGENVGPGTPLLSLDAEDEPQVLIYLNARHTRYALQGQALRLRLPDGSWLGARVERAVDDAVPVPQELRPAFSPPTRSLKVVARLDAPLPAYWRIHHLALTAHFPHRWPWLEAWAD